MFCQSRKDPEAERATDARSAAYGVRPSAALSYATSVNPRTRDSPLVAWLLQGALDN